METKMFLKIYRLVREKWWRIDNQGKGVSCVGWAVAGVLKWHFVKAHKLLSNEKLSAR